MNIVSACCLKPVVSGEKKWYPLGGFFYIIDKIDVCEGCGKECEDTIEVHECCGLEHCQCEAVSV